MTHQADIAEDEAPPRDAAAELYARQMADLRGMAELAMGFAADMKQRTTWDRNLRPRETAEAFDRYARALRLTIALERRLQAEEAQRLAPDPEAEAALAILAARSSEPPVRVGPSPDYTRADGRRDVVDNVVREMVEAHDEEHPGFDRVGAMEDLERLIERDIPDGDALDRPILELVALICKELGVAPDWSLWTPEDWTEPHWGLTEAELAETAHPLGPYQPCSADWPPPGTVMPLPGTTPTPPTPSPP